jgi:hypothetical protein
MYSRVGILRKAFIIIPLLCVISACLYAGPEWRLRRDENGIKVYTANTENSNFKSVKVECIMNARLSQLIAYLFDVDKQHDWVYSAKNTRLLKKIGSNEMVFYSEVSVPWPCTNRDYIAHITVIQRSPALVTIDSHSEPDMLPPTPGKIRVRSSLAHWDVTPINSQSLKIVYTAQFDPAGAIPAWLINLFVTKGPYQTFQRLREEVAKPVNKNARVDFIKDWQ